MINARNKAFAFFLSCQQLTPTDTTTTHIKAAGITDSDQKLSMQHVISKTAGSKSGLLEKAWSRPLSSLKCDLNQKIRRSPVLWHP